MATIQEYFELQYPRRERRSFICQACGKVEYHTAVPRAWYSIKRHSGIPLTHSAPLGLTCSPECLAAHAQRLLQQAQERRVQ